MVTEFPTSELLAGPEADISPVPGSIRVREMVVRNLDAVWRTARRLGLSDADLDDLTQDVAMVALKREAAIEPGKERAFMLATAVHIAANWRRSRRRRRFERAIRAVGSPSTR